MKKLIVLLLAICAFNVSFSQEKNESIDSVVIQSDTAYIEVDYDFYYDGVKYSNGVAGYQFTISDTIGKVTFEGSYDGVNYVTIYSLDSLTGDTALFDVDPDYYKYRIGLFGFSGDTATSKNNIFFEKIPSK